MECIDGTQAHHWMIDPSRSATSKGTCKRCGSTQKFHNSIGAMTTWKEAGEKFRKHQLTNLGGKVDNGSS